MQSNQVSVGQSGLAAQYNNLRDDAYGGSILRPHQQGTPIMTLYVEPGSYFINGPLVKFGGGNTPSFTAPVTHPRIDIVTLDASGTVAITQGTEASSPVTPAYPANKIVICEVYNVVGETAIYTTNSTAYGWTSSQGYIQNDSRSILQFVQNPTAIASDLDPDATDTRSLGSSGNEWLNIYGKNVYTNGALVAASKFGGTGADGALSISSGTTTINCSNAAVVVKNYTSISITGTANLAFSNPHANGTIVILKSQGNVTITSSISPCIDLNSMGSTGYGFGLINGPSAPYGATIYGNQIASGGAQVGSFNGGRGVYNASSIYGKGVNVFVGAGGSNGGSGSGSTSGTGGLGGGGLYIECAGSLNFTGVVRSDGSSGGNGGGSNTFNTLSNAGDGGGSNTDGTTGTHYNTISSGQAGAGGGGGGGGSVCILYNTLTANSGTITVAGGTGGTGGNDVAGGAGGNGWSLVALNTEFS